MPCSIATFVMEVSHGHVFLCFPFRGLQLRFTFGSFLFGLLLLSRFSFSFYAQLSSTLPPHLVRPMFEARHPSLLEGKPLAQGAALSY